MVDQRKYERVDILGFKFNGIHRGSRKGGSVGILIWDEIKFTI